MGKLKHWVKLDAEENIIESWMSSQDKQPVPEAIQVPEDTPLEVKNKLRRKAGRFVYCENGSFKEKKRLEIKIDKLESTLGEDITLIFDGKDVSDDLKVKVHEQLFTVEKNDNQLVLSSTRAKAVKVKIDDPKYYSDQLINVSFKNG